MSCFAYIRVSTKEQNPDRQIAAMRELGIPGKRIFIDYISGKDFERPQYKCLCRRLKPHDLLIVKSIDRLGRNYSEILEQWRILTKEKEVDIEVLDMPLLNTRSESEGLTGIFIADMVLQILAYVAETERTFIKQRQAEGIKIAKEKGVRFGRKSIEFTMTDNEILRAWIDRQISTDEAMAVLNVSRSTLYRKKQIFLEM